MEVKQQMMPQQGEYKLSVINSVEKENFFFFNNLIHSRLFSCVWGCSACGRRLRKSFGFEGIVMSSDKWLAIKRHIVRGFSMGFCEAPCSILLTMMRLFEKVN